ncbi:MULTISPECIES: 16S rRNA (uracil(1498)-N(3))-methyltransferase [Listeria]|uniref:16S rRNA (uracil(1498)-N(3))-methyltransferase n=1 Tax=Listeria TaxID=1637 RepID=UPI000B5963AB|nr:MULTISPECIES: 16S rRNA (uracil(1498)-N(3))-methyltransferase [Listeria]
MQRYFTSQKVDMTKPFSISGDDFHHMSRVMRMKTGDQIYVVDCSETAFVAELTNLVADSAELRVLKKLEQSPELPAQISIASGLPKGDKLELIVQKATELGAHAFIPFAAERSITKWEAKKMRKKLERLEKIAKEAAEQSHRTHIPSVSFCENLTALMATFADYDYVLCAYEESAREHETKTLVATFEKMQPGERLLVIFGPEGGMSENEVARLVEEDASLAGLGPRILRTETAPFYVLAAASYHFELR